VLGRGSKRKAGSQGGLKVRVRVKGAESEGRQGDERGRS
jgi:hypothetical protein